MGEVADDGVPEPLQFVLNDGVRLMLIPTGGFGWVIGDHEVAPPGQSECIMNLEAAMTAGVDEIVERAQQPWGYASALADPDGHLWMVTSGPFPSED